MICLLLLLGDGWPLNLGLNRTSMGTSLLQLSISCSGVLFPVAIVRNDYLLFDSTGVACVCIRLGSTHLPVPCQPHTLRDHQGVGLPLPPPPRASFIGRFPLMALVCSVTAI